VHKEFLEEEAASKVRELEKSLQICRMRRAAAE